MIRLDSFITRLLGKKVDTDNYPAYNKYQCVDLVKQWAKENGWKITSGNALYYRGNADGINYSWCPNYIWAVPRPGDIIVFDLSRLGHIGIVVSANVFVVKVFEQNNPLGSACHLRNYNYIRPKCLGWLRPLGPGTIKIYVVKKGDSLYKIAKSQLGNGNRWREIYNLNRSIIGSNPNYIKIGQKLTLP